MNRFNLPRHRLSTGLQHGPRAPNVHPKPLFLRGSRHQPRAPNQTFGLRLKETLDINDDDSQWIKDGMILVCFEFMTTFYTVSVFLSCLALGLFDYPLGVFQFHLAAPYEIVGGC